MFETVWQDLRHGARMLAKNPGFSLIAIMSIAIGVGANAAMFSIADGLILRPLAVPAASELITLSATTPAGEVRNSGISYPDYVDIRNRARSFQGLAATRFVTASLATRRDESAHSTFGARGQRKSLRRPSRPAGHGTSVCSGRGSRHRPRCCRRALARDVDRAVRRRPGDRRPRDPSHRRAVHGDRRHATRVHRPQHSSAGRVLRPDRDVASAHGRGPARPAGATRRPFAPRARQTDTRHLDRAGKPGARSHRARAAGGTPRNQRALRTAGQTRDGYALLRVRSACGTQRHPSGTGARRPARGVRERGGTADEPCARARPRDRHSPGYRRQPHATDASAHHRKPS